MRIGFEIRAPIIGNIKCLYEEDVGVDGRPLEAVEELNERQQLIRISLGRNLLIRTRESSGLCPAEGELRGRATVLGTPPTIKLL